MANYVRMYIFNCFCFVETQITVVCLLATTGALQYNKKRATQARNIEDYYHGDILLSLGDTRK